MLRMCLYFTVVGVSEQEKRALLFLCGQARLKTPPGPGFLKKEEERGSAPGIGLDHLVEKGQGAGKKLPFHHQGHLWGRGLAAGG